MSILRRLTKMRHARTACHQLLKICPCSWFVHGTICSREFVIFHKINIFRNKQVWRLTSHLKLKPSYNYILTDKNKTGILLIKNNRSPFQNTFLSFFQFLVFVPNPLNVWLNSYNFETSKNWSPLPMPTFSFWS